MAKPPEQTNLPIALDPPVPQPLQDHGFDALFGHGPLSQDAAIRVVANYFRDIGLLEPFKKLRLNSAPYRHIATVVRALLDAGRLHTVLFGEFFGKYDDGIDDRQSCHAVQK